VAGIVAIGAEAASASQLERVRPDASTSDILIADSTGESPGELNQIGVGLAPDHRDDYRLTDSAGILNTPAFCLRESGTSVRCNKVAVFPPDPSDYPVGRIFVALGGGNDQFGVLDPLGIPRDVLLEAEGGRGNDEIRGRRGAGREMLSGNQGDDLLVTGAPAEDKELEGGEGNDTIIITSDHSALAAKAHRGGKLNGGSGRDRLKGCPANDKLFGGTGNDVVRGGQGNDKIDCGPGTHDLGIGGPGRDLGRNCETIKH
jgi:hypothetical protein